MEHGNGLKELEALLLEGWPKLAISQKKLPNPGQYAQ